MDGAWPSPVGWGGEKGRGAAPWGKAAWLRSAGGGGIAWPQPSPTGERGHGPVHPAWGKGMAWPHAAMEAGGDGVTWPQPAARGRQFKNLCGRVAVFIATFPLPPNSLIHGDTYGFTGHIWPVSQRLNTPGLENFLCGLPFSVDFCGLQSMRPRQGGSCSSTSVRLPT